MYWFSIFNSSSMQVSFFVWKLMKWAPTDSLSTSPQQSTQALEYLFKFIVQSRILYSRATCGMEEEQFRASIQELFQSIRFVLSLDSRSSENLVFTQVRRFTLQTTLKIPLMSPAHQPFLSFVKIFFVIFSFIHSQFAFIFHCLSLLTSFIPVTFICCVFLIDASILHCHCWALLGLIFGQSRAFISCMPLCVHAPGLSSSSVSDSAPLCLFHNAADAAQPDPGSERLDVLIWE